MCRKNQLLGIAVLAFGLGLMVACWMASEFVRNCLGFLLIGLGVLILQKK